jgi:hypothetical protein
MEEKTEIQAVELVREIRDQQVEFLAEKSRSEIIAFFAQAGEDAREAAHRKREAVTGVNKAALDMNQAERGACDEKEDSEIQD